MAVVLPVFAACLILPPATVAASPPAAPQSAQPASAEDQLAQTYSPVAYLRHQAEPCASPPDGGEPYVPSPVEIALNDPAVTLRQAGSGDAEDDPVVVVAPSATDLANATEEMYLDYPGNPRDPGCAYEEHARARMSELGLQPTTYARVVLDAPNRRLALQYWFFTYFNDWNNTHESDWEMIQLMWEDIGSVEESLTRPPTTVGYAQHGGGELAAWGDEKLGLEDGTHPAVYPAAGSHATFFGRHTYVGWGENGTGFGCDVTITPHDRVPLTAVLVPEEPDPSGPFAWLLFAGRWGERQPSEFNGPKGPNLGKKWTDPWEATETWRTSSLKVPESNALGPTATDLFCAVSTAGSKVLIYAGVYPWLALGGALVVLVLFVLLLRHAWPGFRDAWRLYARHWRTFLGIGVLAIPIGWAFNGLEVLLVENPPMEWVVKWFNDTAGARLTAALLVGGVQQLAMLLLIGPAVVQAVLDVREGREPGVGTSYREVMTHFGQLVGALVLTTVVVGALLLTIVGFPFAVWFLVRWQFFGQATIFHHAEGGRAALRTSGAAVRGRWWQTMAASLAYQALGSLPGPLIGVILLIFGKTSVQFANGLSSFVYALTFPIAVIALTLFYLRLRGEPVPVEAAVEEPGQGAVPSAAPA